MDLAIISTLAQVVSAVGVIISLVYLAVQVRQNTRAVRNSTHHALTVTRLDYIAMVAQSAELSHILWVGTQDFSQLNEEERYRFHLIMYYLFSAGENFYYQQRQGTLDAEQWERWCGTLRYYFTQPGIRAWFAASPIRFAASFGEFLEREFRSLAVEKEKQREPTTEGPQVRRPLTLSGLERSSETHDSRWVHDCNASASPNRG